jgi:hypothetical protein
MKCLKHPPIDLKLRATAVIPGLRLRKGQLIVLRLPFGAPVPRITEIVAYISTGALEPVPAALPAETVERLGEAVMMGPRYREG